MRVEKLYAGIQRNPPILGSFGGRCNAESCIYKCSRGCFGEGLRWRAVVTGSPNARDGWHPSAVVGRVTETVGAGVLFSGPKIETEGIYGFRFSSCRDGWPPVRVEGRLPSAV